MKKTKNIKISLSSEEKINQEFIDAWHRAEKDEIQVAEEHLYFLESETFFRILSNKRIALLKLLHSLGASDIQNLSKILKRSSKNVYHDIILLKQAGLIRQDKNKMLFVPWDKINTEIALAA
jgi:predicted transcriptional regulator